MEPHDEALKQILLHDRMRELAKRVDEITEELAEIAREQTKIISEVVMESETAAAATVVPAIVDRVIHSLAYALGAEAVRKGIEVWLSAKLFNRDKFEIACRDAERIYFEAMREIEEGGVDGEDV